MNKALRPDVRSPCPWPMFVPCSSLGLNYLQCSGLATPAPPSGRERRSSNQQHKNQRGENHRGPAAPGPSEGRRRVQGPSKGGFSFKRSHPDPFTYAPVHRPYDSILGHPTSPGRLPESSWPGTSSWDCTAPPSLAVFSNRKGCFTGKFAAGTRASSLSIIPRLSRRVYRHCSARQGFAGRGPAINPRNRKPVCALAFLPDPFDPKQVRHESSKNLARRHGLPHDPEISRPQPGGSYDNFSRRVFYLQDP